MCPRSYIRPIPPQQGEEEGVEVGVGEGVGEAEAACTHHNLVGPSMEDRRGRSIGEVVEVLLREGVPLGAPQSLGLRSHR